MSQVKLSVEISIEPLQSEISIGELDELFGGEIAKFETWFVESQRGKGFEGQGLMSIEHAILRSYMYYVHTRPVAGE